jgi:fatty-acyl-CoA synthase
MAAPTALVQVLDYRSTGAGALPPIGFLDARGVTGEMSRAELLDGALAAAASIAHHGVRPGDRVVVTAPTSPDYLSVLLGCLLSQVVPCTVAPPNNPAARDSASVRHLHAAVAAVRPTAVIAADDRLATAVPAGTPVLTFAQLGGHGSVRLTSLGPADPDAAHHIQLTSGSTSAPKAVVLTHANVAANVAAIASAAMLSAADRVSIWLPLHHDMGLVQVLTALTHPIGLDLMPPVGFLRDPLSWLRHISDRGATLTAAPPFAYSVAADRHRRRPPAGLDLSALRQAYVGAEPIPLATLRRFRDTFAPHGLADETLLPCYGMAETVLATTLATDPVPGSGDDQSFGRVRWRQFDRASLDELQIAARPIPARATRSVVSCGTTIPGLSLRLVDGSGDEIGQDRVGAIEVRGTSVMSGYLTPDGLARPPGGWHQTGDLGVRLGGELYVVGRTKEMLIVNGRNLPPYDVEELVEEHPHVIAGGAVVFSCPNEDKGTEPVVAVVESRAATGDWPTIRDEVATTVRQVFGLSLAEVVVLPRGAIPRTSSGKRQRAALRNAYLAGQLG